MAQHGNKDMILQQRIDALTRKYEAGLKDGTEFSVLKDIRDQVKLLKEVLQKNNPSVNDSAYQGKDLSDPLI